MSNLLERTEIELRSNSPRSSQIQGSLAVILQNNAQKRKRIQIKIKRINNFG